MVMTSPRLRNIRSQSCHAGLNTLSAGICLEPQRPYLNRQGPHPVRYSSDLPVIMNRPDLVRSHLLVLDLYLSLTMLHTARGVTSLAADHLSHVTLTTDATTPRITHHVGAFTSGKDVFPELQFTTSRGLSSSSLYAQSNVTTDIILKCVANNATLYVAGDTGTISFNLTQEAAADDRQKGRKCEINIDVVGDNVVLLSLEESIKCLKINFEIVDARPDSRRIGRPCLYPTAETYSYTNRVTLVLQTTISLRYDDYFRFLFQSVPLSVRPQLEISFTSPLSGYIQTPGWDWRTPKQYATNIDSWARVEVPDGHYLMLSSVLLPLDFSKTDCSDFYDTAKIYLDGNTTRHFVFTLFSFCRTLRLLPTVYQATLLFVHFLSDSEIQNKGFRLVFSFHRNPSSLLAQSQGRLNCSVPEWSDFQPHYACNLVPECLNSEDEANCPYFSDKCGAGFVSTGEGCFQLIRGLHKTWYEANEYCLSKGMRLPVLNTKRKLDSFYGVFGRLDGVFTYLGLHNAPRKAPNIYGELFSWVDGCVAHSFQSTGKFSFPMCFMLSLRPSLFFLSDSCSSFPDQGPEVLCELVVESAQPQEMVNLPALPSEQSQAVSGRMRLCPSGHVTHDFLSCDVRSTCLIQTYGSVASCLSSLSSQQEFFACANEFESLPFTLVCDHRQDCADGSDEDFCVFPSCDIDNRYDCGNKQCLRQEYQCDGIAQCVNDADEDCAKLMTDEEVHVIRKVLPPVRLDLSPAGKLETMAIYSPLVCPDTHFRCPGEDLICLPVFLRCNDLHDCPGLEDEAECATYTCPGYFRCRDSTVCVHPDHLCDGLNHCPQRDDELLCNMTSPRNCTSSGLSFSCTGPFDARQHADLRYLDARGTGMSPSHLHLNKLLIYLNLAACNITVLGVLALPNLRILDLRDNSLTTVSQETFAQLLNLQYLSLAGNMLDSFSMSTEHWKFSLGSVVALNISRNPLQYFVVKTFQDIFPNLKILDLSDSGTIEIIAEDTATFTNLQVLYMKGCPMDKLHPLFFRGLTKLDSLTSENFKICCPQLLPEGFDPNKCSAPLDEISSCEALLQSDVYRVFLSLFVCLAFTGNLASFVYRVFINKTSSNLGFDVFVTNLCVSDFLMSVYLVCIWIADRVYQGGYVWNDATWRNSATCKAAGFFAFLSCEVSAFIILIITVDRFLVLHLPFSGFHFQKRSARISCTIAWLLGLILAGFPLLPFNSHWNFYSQNGICIPLPVTRSDFPGRLYSFRVMVVLNFVLVLLIGVGQAFIYWSIRTNSMSLSNTNKQAKDLTVARRLITVAMSNFMCWFPIGLLGILASSGLPVPGEVNVGLAIFVLPLNAALNPFLYTVNVISERRARRKEANILKYLSEKKTEIFTIPQQT